MTNLNRLLSRLRLQPDRSWVVYQDLSPFGIIVKKRCSERSARRIASNSNLLCASSEVRANELIDFLATGEGFEIALRSSELPESRYVRGQCS